MIANSICEMTYTKFNEVFVYFETVVSFEDKGFHSIAQGYMNK